MADYSSFLAQAKQDLTTQMDAIDYLRKLGLNDDTILRFGLGYYDGSIIIPYNGVNTFYMSFSMSDENIGFRPVGYDGAEFDTFYNIGALSSGNVIFIVESAYSALSIYQAGGKAIAINQSTYVDTLLKGIEYMDPAFDGVFVVALNQNASGSEQQHYLMDQFSKKGIPFIDGSAICGNYLTPNEFMRYDKDGFLHTVIKLRRTAQSTLDSLNKSDNVQNYLETKLNSDMEVFITNKTKMSGFNELDQLSGGLHAGLYVLGGLGASGKTTFLNQMSDQVAEKGEQVLYFTMEQSILELVSKSVAREAYYLDHDSKITSVQLRAGEIDEFNDLATNFYNRVGTNLSIIECEIDFDLQALDAYVSRFIETTRKRPVVIIDYLQAFDVEMRSLRRLSRKYRIPLIVAYCIPRTNYLKPMDLEKFVNLEYSADVIWGLQLKLLTEDVYLKEEDEKKQRDMLDLEMRKNPRSVQLLCLKNRYGAKYSVDFEYYSQNDYFKEQAYQVEELTESIGTAASFKNSQIPDWVLEKYKESLNKN